MLLYIDADQNLKTGWEGFDYLINAGVIDGKQTTVMKREGDTWVRVAEIPYRGAFADRRGGRLRVCGKFQPAGPEGHLPAF